jgi:glycosyltransferase involved in cell wall biosynthesis
MQPKISIVTATLNRQDYLPRCIEGVAGQSYPNKEHVIIDGGSTDGAVEVLKSYAEKYPHLKWISEKDNGISSALNKGLALATGDIIGVNGDDDHYLPGAFEAVAAAFEQNPFVSVVSGNCIHVRNDGAVESGWKTGFTNRRELIEFWKHWGKSVFLPAPSTFFKKAVVGVVGGFDEADRYAMDYHHWIKITEKFEVKTIDQVLAKFRHDEGSISFSQGREQLAEMYVISRKHWGSLFNPDFYRLSFSYFQHHKWPPLRDRLTNSIRYRLRRLLKAR